MLRPVFTYLFIVFVSIFVGGCNTSRPDTVDIFIYQTTDVHGTLFPFDFTEGKPIDNSLAQVSDFINEQRRVHGSDAVILLDNGDLLQGQPTVYYYNFEDTVSPHLAASVLNYMKYDAASVGNHDIETGHPIYDRFCKEITFPYLAANAIDVITGEPYFEPYIVIERKGLKIAVLGLITPGIPKWLPENLWSGIRFEDMVLTAQKWIPVIRQKEHPDLIIGLFHSGVDHTYDNPTGEQFMNENACRLVAQNVPGFDVVLAGHDHKYYNEKLVNVAGDTVHLLDPRSHARAVAALKVSFKKNRGTNSYSKAIDAQIIEMKNHAPDSLFMVHFKPSFDEMQQYVSRTIGSFTKPIDSKDAYFGNSAFIDLIQTVQLEVSKAKVSFCSPLTYRTQIAEGPILVGDLFKLYKYENLLYTLSLTGNEIDKYLEYSYAMWFNTMKNNRDYLIKMVIDSTGKARLKNKYYNFSSASGIDYLVDVSKPDGDKIRILGFSNGTTFFTDSLYPVAVNSYQANGGGGHLTLGVGLSAEDLKNRVLNASDLDLRFYLMKWIEKKQTIQPEKKNNWRVIPEDYYEFAKSRDMKLLFEDSFNSNQE